MRRGLCSLLALCFVAPPGLGQNDPEVPLLPKGVTRETRASIEKALKFLAREQSKDGSWRSGGGYGYYPCAMSGLAGLALLASGSTPTRGPYAKNVRRVTRYLLSQQQPNGLISAPAEESRSMYGHGFGLLFLSQVYGMEEDVQKQQRIKQACKRAIQLIARSQSRDGGWLYTPDSGGDEGSVTVTQIQALRSCRNAGIHVPKKTIDNAIRYIERSQSPDGGVRYSVRSHGSRPALTAAACAVLYNAGVYDSKMADRAFRYAWKTCLPTGGRHQGHYFYTQLYMSQACWQKGDKYWDKYYQQIQRRLLSTQQGNGSWNGDHVGLVYGTAIGLLILQIPYNKLPILSR
ncbi:MAG: prenyltransferase/squalene oxidase repeat-containing protein [Planctomycetota bacterium]